MAAKAKDIAAHIGGEVVGDGEALVTGVNSIEDAAPGDIVFLESSKFAKALKGSRASCVLSPVNIEGCDKTVIRCKNPSLSITKIIDKFFPQTPSYNAGISEKAAIDKAASLGKGAAVGAYSVIEAGASVGDGSVIYPHVYIGKGAHIGSETVIYPHVTIREKCRVGNKVVIHSGAVIGADGFGFARDGASYFKIPQIGIVVIDDDVEIGAGVTIDRARFGKTFIGRGTKIDNLVHIAHNVRVGEDTIIIAQTGISGSVNVGKGVIIGGQVGITDHVEIGDGAIIASKSGITKSVPPKTMMSWIPARPHNVSKRLVALIDSLPMLYERVSNLEKKPEESGK